MGKFRFSNTDNIDITVLRPKLYVTESNIQVSNSLDMANSSSHIAMSSTKIDALSSTRKSVL